MSGGTILLQLRHISAAQEGTWAEHYSGLGNLFLTNSPSLLIPIFSSGFVSTVCLIICSGSFPRLKVRFWVYNSLFLKRDIVPAGSCPMGPFQARGGWEEHRNFFLCSPPTGLSLPVLTPSPLSHLNCLQPVSFCSTPWFD